MEVILFPALIHSEGESVARRLHALGLDLALLQEAIFRGQLKRDMCTAHHPATLGGIYAWGETNGALREITALRGWSRSDASNICRTISPDGKVAVTAIGGDENTGNRHRSPTTSRPRGAAGIQIVERNQQLSLFGEDEASNVQKEIGQQPQTWYLLYRREGSKVFSELSLPIVVSDDGVIKHWQERIILPVIDLTDGPSSGNEDHGPAFDVDVRRRVS